MPFPANSVYRIQLDADTILTQTYRLNELEHFTQLVWWGSLIRWKRKCCYALMC